jgi:cold shock CspA family protein
MYALIASPPDRQSARRISDARSPRRGRKRCRVRRHLRFPPPRKGPHAIRGIGRESRHRHPAGRRGRRGRARSCCGSPAGEIGDHAAKPRVEVLVVIARIAKPVQQAQRRARPGGGCRHGCEHLVLNVRKPIGELPLFGLVKCKMWNGERGFGFIASDSGSDVFVHATALGSLDRLSPRDRVASRRCESMMQSAGPLQQADPFPRAPWIGTEAGLPPRAARTVTTMPSGACRDSRVPTAPSNPSCRQGTPCSCRKLCGLGGPWRPCPQAPACCAFRTL